MAQEHNDRLAADAIPRAIYAKALREAGKTWAEIGTIMKVSRQRAQQLAQKAPK